MAITAALGLAAPSLAQELQGTAPYAWRQLDDPQQEARARALMATLRCLQCQGQSIADSDAPIAGAMRSLVRERIAQGQTPAQIRSWLIGRYGDYVSYAPPLDGAGWPLYALPVVLVVLGTLIARTRLGRRAS
ncbi:cytochrome c-type biogenesis protein CcmH [Novosphingobium sp. 9]|uniref:cytochrome c-type biogenesis protein n=1 Tax=Novosphingobium sp. 9 TaxID=2025349 RepID=UPI0021B6951E|nr:cytochrome c-type biogenesis protein [Novosphingobium sp. 9]